VIDSGFDMSDFSMMDLFRMEVEGQAEVLNENLLALESDPQSPGELEALMRAAHSVKGAARIIDLDAAVTIAHVMEDCFVAAQRGTIVLDSTGIDVLLQGVDFLVNISGVGEAGIESWLAEHQGEVEALPGMIAALYSQEEALPSHRVSGEAETELEPPEELPFEPFIADELPDESVETTTASAGEFDLSDMAMMDLFRMEVEGQAEVLNENLLVLENDPQSPEALECLMRAAHSVKGAARIIDLDAAVNIAHVLEDCFVAAQGGTIVLDSEKIDILLQGIDLLVNISGVGEAGLESWLVERRGEIETWYGAIAALYSPTDSPEHTASRPEILEEELPREPEPEAVAPVVPPKSESALVATGTPKPTVASKSAIANRKAASSPIQDSSPATNDVKDRVVRVSADNLNRIMGLAGESLVEANWLEPFGESLLRLKKHQRELCDSLAKLQEALSGVSLNSTAEKYLQDTQAKGRQCQELLIERLNELDLFARRSANLSDSLYREVISSHMRPFEDGVSKFFRMVRDLAKNLGKQAKLELIGKSTQVDRDILEKLDAPLTHILRNSIDHGIELPEERIAAGKPPRGEIRLEAVHRAGMLSITIADDGRGIDVEKLRQKVVQKGFTSAEMAGRMTEAELMEFLFVPGFSTAHKVTEISGRGVGLDIALSMAQEVGGTVRAVSQPGKGMAFHFQLPLTLSVIRTLIVEISGEPYAFPLTRIDRILLVAKSQISTIESRRYFTFNGENIGLVAAHQVLELPEPNLKLDALPVIVIGDRDSHYGLVVDKFLGERDLVVRPLDPRLGKVPDISAAALREDGSLVLIVDVADLVRSIDSLLTSQDLSQIQPDGDNSQENPSKRVLVVDDSLTVREMERKLLENNGYQVEIAVNGMDGWNAARSSHFDLVVTDVDMPRMTGIEFTSLMRQHPKLKSIPVVIVSYKDREEDRVKGLDAGANYYLTKSSFHDNTFIKAVRDLIGE
jgi:two-component system, chemotaxis family, sensor histidine kinase and response regulator WspE